MAGRPVRRNMLQRIEAAGGDDWLLEQVAAGRTLASIAEDVGITRPKLNAYLREEARRDSYVRAQEQAASALVDQSLAIVDAAEPQTVQVAKLRADTRRWIAGKLDRTQWGEQQGPLVNIDLGQLHLEALRSASRPVIAHEDDEWLE